MVVAVMYVKEVPFNKEKVTLCFESSFEHTHTHTSSNDRTKLV